MREKDVKIGMKVVPHSKSIGVSLEEWDDFVYKFFKGMGFVYVLRPFEDGGFELGIDKNEEGIGDYFLALDFEPYITMKKIESFDEPVHCSKKWNYEAPSPKYMTVIMPL